jgi:hypothetical protein
MRGSRIRQIFASNGQMAGDTEYFKLSCNSVHLPGANSEAAVLGKNLPVID